MRLVLQPGDSAVELNRASLVAGRHSSADICLRLPDVSRRHCRFVYVNGHWHIIDLESLNGIFVNQERVQSAVLQHRDLVQIGGYLFEVDLHPGEPTVQLPKLSTRPQQRFLESISEALPDALPFPQPRQLAS